MRNLALAFALVASIALVPGVALASHGALGECNSAIAKALPLVTQVLKTDDSDSLDALCAEILVIGSILLVDPCGPNQPHGQLFIDRIRGRALDRICEAVYDICGIPLDVCLE